MFDKFVTNFITNFTLKINLLVKAKRRGKNYDTDTKIDGIP